MEQTVLEQTEHAGIAVKVFPDHAQAVTVDALCTKKAVCLVYKDGVIDRNGEFDVAGMAGA